jgi:hypothetical protein
MPIGRFMWFMGESLDPLGLDENAADDWDAMVR